ncbi:biotin/lipoyl-containing protein [Rhodanobacter sp. 115]|uniref:biotin/lipoyl-containing protein n=1 Tax=Rhodanobacter sp. FW021-MT20 TaxID=1162282 RepID=UPI000260D2F1|nr:pyruvate dehydrogenase complex dihydrolipoamide acetyltransferase [Rhodanobacter sp. 115]
MADLKEVHVPDIGGHDNVPVIEVLIKPGDRVEKDQSLITLEIGQGHHGGARHRLPAP